ncbi:MAG: hypothetical protein WCH79_12165 [Planctomycetia bacterium]
MSISDFSEIGWLEKNGAVDRSACMLLQTVNDALRARSNPHRASLPSPRSGCTLAALLAADLQWLDALHLFNEGFCWGAHEASEQL